MLPSRVLIAGLAVVILSACGGSSSGERSPTATPQSARTAAATVVPSMPARTPNTAVTEPATAAPTATPQSTPTAGPTVVPSTPTPTPGTAPTKPPTAAPAATPLPGGLGVIQVRLQTVAEQFGTFQNNDCRLSDRLSGLPAVGACSANLRGVDGEWPQILVTAQIFAESASASAYLAQGIPPDQQAGVTFIDQPLTVDESEFYLAETPGNEVGPCFLLLKLRSGSMVLSITSIAAGDTCPPYDSTTDALLGIARTLLG